MNNIQQNLLQAIDLIAINQASAVNFDTTEIATVLSKLDNGNYWVSNGKVKYEAKSTETISYTENTQVYVSISQGDYSQDKVIIGRYDNRKEEEKAYLYEDPYQRLGVSHITTVTLTDENEISFLPTALGQPTLLGIETSVNTNTEQKGSYGYYNLQINLLNNNNETLMSFIIDSRNFIGNPYNMVSGIKHKNIFTLPNDFNISDVEKIKATSYGDDVEWSSITLKFGYDLESETIINSESKAFIGTDNGFNTYSDGDNDSYREVLIKRYEQIPLTNDDFFAIQDLENVLEFDNELNTKNVITTNSDDNSAPKFYFKQEKLNENGFYKIRFKYFIKTNSVLNEQGVYGKIIGMSDVTNVGALPFNKEPGKWHNEFFDFQAVPLDGNLVLNIVSSSDDKYFDSDKLYIYFKDIELYELQPIPLNYLYFSWVKDGQVYNPNNPTSLETSISWYKYTPNKIDEDLGVGWEKINNENAWTLDVSDNYLDYNIPEERFRARLVYNDVDYLSNVLVLKNKDYVGEAAAAVSPTMTLRLNDDGIYLYDHTAQLYETEKILKTITASSNAGFEDDYRDLYWLIPKNSTMIAAPRAIEKKNGGVTEYWYWDYLPDIHFSDKPTDFTSSVSDLKDYDLDTNNYYIIGGNGIKFEQNIYIKRSYQPNYLNNTIQCKAFFGDTTTANEEGSIDLKFVSANNSGVETSLGIELVSEKGYLGGDNTGDVEVKGIVYDKNGIPFEEQPEIIYKVNMPIQCYFDDNRDAGENVNSISIIDDVIKIERGNYVPGKNVAYQLIMLPNGYNGKAAESGEYHLTPLQDTTYSIELESLGKNGYITIYYDMYRDDTNIASDRSKRVGGILYRFYLDETDSLETNKPNFLYNIDYRYSNSHYLQGKKIKINLKYLNKNNTPKDFKDKYENYLTNYNAESDLLTFDSLYSGCHTFSEEANGVYQVNLNIYCGDETNKIPGAMPYINFTLPGRDNGECEFRCSRVFSYDIDAEQNKDTVAINTTQWSYYNIKASCAWNSETTNKPVQLTSYYQVPYFPTTNVYQLEGPTKFTYSSFGDMPYPASINEYKLFDSRGNEITDFIMFVNTNLVKVNNDKHLLILPNLAPAEESFYTLSIYNNSLELIAQYPLTLLRNGYAFKEINAWGGSTVTTEDYVISPMIGAGSKNSQNQFTGVIMGTSSEFPSTGLYGFQNGIATFGFKEDGSCFIGANEETGKIEFNIGNNGGEMIINATINRTGSLTHLQDSIFIQGNINLEEKEITYFENNFTFKGIFSGLNLISNAQEYDNNNSSFNTLIGNFCGFREIDEGIQDSEAATFLLQHSCNFLAGSEWYSPKLKISCLSNNNFDATVYIEAKNARDSSTITLTNSGISLYANPNTERIIQLTADRIRFSVGNVKHVDLHVDRDDKGRGVFLGNVKLIPLA